METVLSSMYIIVTAVLLAAISGRMLHMYQLSSYRLKGVMNWLKASHYEYILRYFAYAFFATGMMLLFNFCFPYENVHYFSYIIFAVLGIVFIVLNFTQKSKVPLAFTPRMVRLIMVNSVLSVGLAVGGWALSFTIMQEAAYGVLPLLVPLICLISYAITYPIEKAIANSFIKDATEEVIKAKAKGLKVIGITGSYGKTTAKNILSAMLSVKYKVCASPKSYNTPLGICRTVNNCLSEDDEYLVAEMGARRKGDIAELCRVAQPDIAIITGVGTQHYETFGSVEAIAETKYEIVEGLSEGGKAVFNGDDEGALKLAERYGEGAILSGAEGKVKYKDLEISVDGTKFTMELDNGESYTVKTRLAGRHIASMICLCTAVATELGVPACACAKVSEKLAPVNHRLEVIKHGNRVIIDDAYNSNTKGAKNALEVLASFDGKKVIVTPGMVELGELEEQSNTEFGESIGKTCDLAILIGTRAKQIKAGAIKAGMSEENIIVVSSLKMAGEHLKQIKEKAAILFENDLPDNYK